MYSNQKKLVIIVAAILTVAMAFTLTGCGGASGDAKGVVNAFFDSIDKHDAKKFMNCFQEDTREMMLEDMEEEELEDLLEMMDEALADEYGDNWRRKVKVGKAEEVDTEDDITYYDVSVEMEEQEDVITVLKIKGKYYIDESAFGSII